MRANPAVRPADLKPAAPSFMYRQPGMVVVTWTLAGILALPLLMWAGWSRQTGMSRPLQGSQHLILALACLLLCPLPFTIVARLRDQWAVWTGRRAPRAALRQALRDLPGGLAITWLLGAVPLLVLRAAGLPPVAGLPELLAPVAVFTGLLGLAVWLAAALHGVLPPKAGLILLGAAPLAVLIATAAVDPSGGAAGAGGSGGGPHPPWPMQLAFVALLPSAAWVLHRRLQADRLPQRADGPPQSPWQRWQAWRARWTERFQAVDGKASLGMFGGMMGQLPVNLAKPDPEVHFLQPLGSSLGLAHGWRLALFTALALAALHSTALHWRVLLAPGHRLRASLGWRIIGGTLAMLGLWCGLILLVSGFVAWLLMLADGPASGPRGLGWWAARSLPLLSDLLLATALAVWLRAVAGSRGWAYGLVAAAALLPGLLMLLAHVLGPGWPFEGVVVRRDAAWLTTQGLATLVFAGLAQRAWARADLGRLARHRP